MKTFTLLCEMFDNLPSFIVIVWAASVFGVLIVADAIFRRSCR